MSLRIRHIDPDATPSRQVSLEALARILPEATIAEVLKECDATQAVLEAGVWPHDFDEQAAGMRLLRGVGEGVLLLWDRGFHSFEMVQAALARGSELLVGLPQTVKPGPPAATLSDGTQLVWVRPANYGRRKRGERVLVRLIRYTLEDPKRPGHRLEHRLITSLLDPEHAGGEELVVAYHSRWEFELSIDEIKSNQRHPPHASSLQESCGRHPGDLRFAHSPLRGEGGNGGGGQKGRASAESAELHQHDASHKGDDPRGTAHRQGGPSSIIPTAS
jgi:hypothetical protein